MNETRNAKVISASIGFEDHGFLTIWIQLDYGGLGQGFGGYALGQRRQMVRSHHCGEWIRQLLLIFDVDQFDKIAGKPCRAQIEGGMIVKLGHFMEDRWFDPKTIDAMPAEGDES